MNKYIKLLLEKLFDDDIFNDVETVLDEISRENEIREIKTLNKLPHNKTKYSSNYTDYDTAKKLVDIGETAYDALMKAFYDYNSSKNEICYKCEFKEYTKLEYNKITINLFNKDNESANIDIMEIFVDDDCKHIKYIHMIELNRCGIRCSQYGEDLAFFYFLVVMLKKYDIEELRIKHTNYINDKVRELNISCNATRKVEHVITTDIINRFPLISISTDENEKEFISIGKIWKNALINLDYIIVFDNGESFYNFLNYWRLMGFKKFKMRSLVGLRYKLHDEDVEDIFSNFIIQYKLVRYSFSDKDEIKDIIYNEITDYIRDVYKDETIKNSWYGISYGEKGKDEDGSFMKVKMEIDYENEDNNHQWHYFIYKFYKTGECKLIKTEKDIKF